MGDCTHCVRPKSRRSSKNFFLRYFRVHLVARRSVWRSSLREPSVSRTLTQQRQAKFAWSQRRKLLTGPAGGKRKKLCFWSRPSSKVKHSIASFSRSGLRRVTVQRSSGTYTRRPPPFLAQIGPDDRTNTLEWRESCSLLSWFAAKFQKNRRLCFVDCSKEVVLSSRIWQQCCAHSIGKCSEMKGVHVVVVVRQYQCPGKRRRSKNWCGFQESPPKGAETWTPSKGFPIGRAAWTSRPGRVSLRCFGKQGGWWERSGYRRVVYVTGRVVGVGCTNRLAGGDKAYWRALCSSKNRCCPMTMHALSRWQRMPFDLSSLNKGTSCRRSFCSGRLKSSFKNISVPLSFFRADMTAVLVTLFFVRTRRGRGRGDTDAGIDLSFAGVWG